MADRSVVVRLIADTSNFNSNMRGAAQSTRQLGDAGRTTSGTMGKLKTALGGLGAFQIVKMGVEFDALKQRSQAAFTTITGSASAANRELSDLYANFKSNPFGYPQILKTSQQLLAMGTTTKDLVREVTDLSDATAAVGGNAELLDRVALAFGQMRAKGTIQAEEMRQLAENGIPAWQMLAHEIGVSVPQAMKMVQLRQVDSERGIQALMQGIESRFGGATANLRKTWTGTWQEFKAQATQSAGEIVKPIMQIGTDGMRALEPLVRTMGQVGSGFASLPPGAQEAGLALAGVAIFSGRLNAAWTTMSANMQVAGARMRLAALVARVNGQEFSRMGYMAGVAGRGVKSLGGSVLSAFGGPIGVAITGATIGLLGWMNEQKKAKEIAAEYRAEVDRVSDSLDRNTLSLTNNGKQTHVYEFLAADLGHGQSLSDILKKNHVDADLARRALEGDMDAAKQLKKIMGSFNGQSTLDLALGSILRQASETQDGIKKAAETMRLAIPEAAAETGHSVQWITRIFDQWRAKGGNLTAMLRGAGLTASEASQIFAILSGTTNSLAGSFGNAGAAAAQMRKDIASAAGQFASVGGAWDTAMSAAQSAGGGGGGGSSRTPSASDDPAFKRAKKAYDDQARALRLLKQADRDRLQPLKDAAKAESDAAAAASKRATALKKVADAAKKASNEAADAVKKAQDQKDAADRNAHDAAALAAAVKNQAAHGSVMDAGAYAAAQAKANAAAQTTAAAQAQAAAALADATSAATEKKRASDSAAAAAAQAKAESDAQAKRAQAAKKAASDLGAALDHIERVYERQHERLLDAKNRAEQRAQRKSEAYSSGVGSAYGGMAKKVDISLNQYLDTLEKQVQAQQKWKDNLITLAAKVPPGVAEQLAKLGPQAAPLVQKLVDGTDRQLGRFVALFGRTGDQAANRLAGQIQVGSALIAAVAANVGQDAADRLAKGIAHGRTSVKQALAVLGGEFDKKTMKIKLGMKNPKAIADALDRILDNTVYLIKPIKTLVHGQQGFRVTGTTTVFGYKDGGWVKGGSGRRDDVPLRGSGGVQPMAMGGEFVVKRDIAQRNKAFFDLLDRTGRMPAPAPQVVYVQAPAGGPSQSHVHHWQLPAGISPRSVVQEMDRIVGLQAGTAG